MERYIEKFDNIQTSISTLKGQLSSLQNQIKNLDQEVRKELEKNYKEIEIKKKKKKDRKPSGFAKPSLISKELANFMNKDEKELVARTDVTKFIINYIKVNGLQNSEDKRYIIPDEVLRKLLRIEINSELTYFNLQKYMNIHFPKNEH